MSLRGPDNREEEVMQAFARYLEIIESGGDGEAFLRSDTALEPELRALTGLDTRLQQVVVPESEFAGQARAFASFRTAVKDEDPDVIARALAWFRPRLFGILGALGLGMGLSAAFASGALPSGKLNSIFAVIPVFGSPSTGSEPPRELITPTRIDDAGSVHHETSPTIDLKDLPAHSTPGLTPDGGESQNAGREGTGNGTPANPDQPSAGPDVAGSVNTPEQPFPTAGQPTADPATEGSQGSDNGNGIGPDGTPPGQSGDDPALGSDNGNSNAGGNGNGVGPDGTPPGQGGDNPGNGNGNAGGNSGNSNAGGNGNGVGPDGTPPGQGGDNPGNGNGNAGGNSGNGVGRWHPAGQGGDNAGQRQLQCRWQRQRRWLRRHPARPGWRQPWQRQQQCRR